MAYGTERASLDGGRLRIVTRTWGVGAAAEYQADLMAPKPGVAGNYEQFVHLNWLDPEEIRAFANTLLKVADEVEHQFDEDDW